MTDSFETMTAVRSYKRAMSFGDARAKLQRCAGTHFDPAIVRVMYGVSLPRLVWALGPFAALAHIPLVALLAQGSSVVPAIGEAAKTAALAGAASVALTGVVALEPVTTAAAASSPARGAVAATSAAVETSTTPIETTVVWAVTPAHPRRRRSLTPPPSTGPRPGGVVSNEDTQRVPPDSTAASAPPTTARVELVVDHCGLDHSHHRATDHEAHDTNRWPRGQRGDGHRRRGDGRGGNAPAGHAPDPGDAARDHGVARDVAEASALISPRVSHPDRMGTGPREPWDAAPMTSEGKRLQEARDGVPWRAWGPYLSERQWGTVREDYSDDGDAWSYFSHDQARSRARTGGARTASPASATTSSGCASRSRCGTSDDPILKERLFGLTNAEGNHGEDVKEYYFYVDNLPTHSYQRWLYKYPHAEFPYEDLVDTNRSRSRHEMEYELLDTGVFDDGRYFDVEVEHAKVGPEDILCRITRAQPLDRALRRCTCSRPCGSATPGRGRRHDRKPRLSRVDGRASGRQGRARRARRLLPVRASTGPSCSSARTSRTTAACGASEGHDAVPEGRHRRSRGARRGHREPGGRGHEGRGAHASSTVAGGGQVAVLRPPHRAGAPRRCQSPFADADEHIATRPSRGGRVLRVDHPAGRRRRREVGDAPGARRDAVVEAVLLLRPRRLAARAPGASAARPCRRGSRNESWFHMVNHDVISMPDKWEYPWYAAWDLAFHCIPLAMVDPDFAKNQLDLMLSQLYLHPSGQMPAYEWNFGDVNPPVHAFATLFLHSLESHLGEVDLAFLKESFTRLMLNFQWWVNRKDPSGRNVFEGGFLGLDNIGVFDRSAKLPTGGRLEQADGTAWMAMFSQNMLELALAARRARPVVRGLRAEVRRALLLDRGRGRPDRRPSRRDVGRRGRLLLRRAPAARRHAASGSRCGRSSGCCRCAPSPSSSRRSSSATRAWQRRIRDYLDRNHDLLTTVADPARPASTAGASSRS